MGTLAATPESLTLSCDEVGKHTGAVTILTDPVTPDLVLACTVEEPRLAVVKVPDKTDHHGEARVEITCTGCGSTTLEFRVPGDRSWQILKVTLSQTKTRVVNPSPLEDGPGPPPGPQRRGVAPTAPATGSRP